MDICNQFTILLITARNLCNQCDYKATQKDSLTDICNQFKTQFAIYVTNVTSKQHRKIVFTNISNQFTIQKHNHNPYKEYFFHPFNMILKELIMSTSENQQTNCRPDDPSRAQLVPLVQILRRKTFPPIQQDSSRNHIEHVRLYGHM